MLRSLTKQAIISGSYTTSVSNKHSNVTQLIKHHFMWSDSETFESMNENKSHMKLYNVCVFLGFVSPAAMMVLACILCSCSSDTFSQSSSSTHTDTLLLSQLVKQFVILSFSLWRTVWWQSLKMYLVRLDDRHITMPVSPIPLPSSSTVLHVQHGGDQQCALIVACKWNKSNY